MVTAKMFWKVTFAGYLVWAMLGSGTVWGQSSSNPSEETARYVFLFIGDGMAGVQVQAAAAYLAADGQNTHGKYDPNHPKVKRLNMTGLPVLGMATTYAADRFITDSASAGTAMACGIKARDAVISQKLNGDNATTLAELAKAKGWKVGIISSVSLDHATPAVFYAHQANRNQYHHIALQLAQSRFDFFGGGGLKGQYDKTGKEDVLTVAKSNGFCLVNDRKALTALRPGTRTIAINSILSEDQALYYEMDRRADPDHQISLAEFTAQGIRLLMNKDGFMMVEGGKIDWACHANDARTAIDDTLSFDEAIGTALQFYRQHPRETLIVVTGDHECGGMTLGFAGTQYDNFFFKLKDQTRSFEAFNRDIYPAYKTAHPWTGSAGAIPTDLKALIHTSFGLNYDELTAYQKAQLDAAYARSRRASPTGGSEEDYLLYGGYEPLTVTITHLLNHRAGIAFNSYAHTGVPVPVFAIGVGASRFAGFYDNTDIAGKLAGTMHVVLKN